MCRTTSPRSGSDPGAGRLVGSFLAAARDNRRVSNGRGFIVGAAIGNGMTAQAATRGGADFLLAVSAGRLRSMGEPSVASLLALVDTNRAVLGFAKAEIRPRTTLPVFVGLAAFDPHLDTRRLLGEVRDAGFDGIANFPTVALLDGQYRQFLERSGYGFAREVALLSAARDLGLATLGYAHARSEALAVAEAGVDIVNVDLGWNSGGHLGVASRMGLEDAAELTAACVRGVRRVSPGTVCLVEGGPIVGPEQMEDVCRAASADGYVGGSTIDRMPMETAIELVTAAFKMVGALRTQVSRLEGRLAPGQALVALAGTTPEAGRIRAGFEQAVACDLPVLVHGEPGTGRGDLARGIHASGLQRARRLGWMTGDTDPERMSLELFGCEPGGTSGRRRTGWLDLCRDSTLVIDDVADLPLDLQHRLAAAVEGRSFVRLNGTEKLPLSVRLVGITRFDPAREPARFSRHLLAALSEITVALPPLRDRLDDLPSIVGRILDTLGKERKHPPRLDPAALRLLMDHAWPGNAGELRTVLQQGLLLAGDGPILPSHLGALAAAARPAGPARASFASERDWILDALRRNRFRRAEAARFLGISRKTLYNKMSAYGLLLAGPARRGPPSP